MLNQEQINFKWNEIKAGVRNIWGNISENELEETKANISQIPNLIHKKYMETNESINNKLQRLMETFDNETDKGHLLNDGISSYQRRPIPTDLSDHKH
jgi:hypothetical protein